MKKKYTEPYFRLTWMKRIRYLFKKPKWYEIHDLDVVFCAYVLSRLKLYRNNSVVDLTFHKLSFEGIEYTLAEYIDKIISLLQFFFEDPFDEEKGEFVIDEDEQSLAAQKAFHMLAEVLPYLWC